MKMFASLGSIYGASNTPNYSNSDTSDAAAKTIGGAMTGVESVASNVRNNVNQITIFPQLEGTPMGNPVVQMFLFAIIVIALYRLMHHQIGGLESELATPRIGLGSFFSIGAQAMIFIVLMKVVFTRYRIPGFSEFVGTA